MKIKTTVERTYVCECRDCGGMFYSSAKKADMIICVGPTCMSDLVQIVDIKSKRVTIEANPKL